MFRFNKLKRICKVLYWKNKYKSSIKIDKSVEMRKYVNININGGRLILNKGVFMNNGCSINCQKYIEIGEYSILGEGVKIYDHNHEYRDTNLKIKDQGFNKKDVKIGKNCWIGSNVTILKGVTIGDNVIIGANILVYKSIPSNMIVKRKEELIMEKIKE